MGVTGKDQGSEPARLRILTPAIDCTWSRMPVMLHFVVEMPGDNAR